MPEKIETRTACIKSFMQPHFLMFETKEEKEKGIVDILKTPMSASLRKRIVDNPIIALSHFIGNFKHVRQMLKVDITL